MTGSRFGILAGYDGSADAEQALRWAAREAMARGTLLTVCTSPAATYRATPAAGPVYELAMGSAEQILGRGDQHARDLMGSATDVRTVLAREPATVALCQRSGSAVMTVVGSRGLGGLAGMLLGSVSSQVAAYANGPVVVVRGRWLPVGTHIPGAVVVGIDGSAASVPAVEFGFEEAALRDAPLLAVCALADAAGSIGGARQVEHTAERVLGRCEKENPDIIVDRLVSPGSPRGTLLTAAADVQAQLLVVGARGRGGLPGMALGSVSYAALRLAPCPVAVVHRG